ncbi:hypothetical protein MLD38_000572 [Melastoma candidum]|uniref:Uncharacterized protein n=1 Tax=Melastoma candidum TaxID=119954 RepID=A0ACB9SAZ1_9MYRT|nr:hypothetical protein MLD38_000572 [Melastoma candidum]
MGRTEDEEMPVFEDGAFEVEEGHGRKEGERLVDQEFVGNYVGRNKMGELIGSARIVGKGQLQCDEWIEESTLMVIRFEYANLFHTMTDWYNGYVSSRVTALPYRPKVVFVDGHCKSPMEETWRALFSGFTYAKHFRGSVCFRHVIFSPLGYDNAMFKGLSDRIDCSGTSSRSLSVNPDDRKTARLSEFGEMMRAAFNFPLDKPLDRGASRHNVLFVRREDYLAHPRHSGKPESRLSNEPEVFEALRTWASSHPGCKVNLVNGLFAHMSMKDQVQAIQDASVIIGAHGAGLTHIVSASPETFPILRL